LTGWWRSDTPLNASTPDVSQHLQAAAPEQLKPAEQRDYRRRHHTTNGPGARLIGIEFGKASSNIMGFEVKTLGGNGPATDSFCGLTKFNGGGIDHKMQGY